jgi:hypothetical protein
MKRYKAQVFPERPMTQGEVLRWPDNVPPMALEVIPLEELADGLDAAEFLLLCGVDTDY